MDDLARQVQQASRASVSAERQLSLAEMQSVIFADRPTRSQLLKLKLPIPARLVRLVVHRNQPFEFVASLLPVFAAYGDFEVEVSIGTYDDTLSFCDATNDADVELIWLDYGRYTDRGKPERLAEWLRDRIAVRRTFTDAPILVAADAAHDPHAQEFNHHLKELLSELPAVRLAPQNEIALHLGEVYWRSDLHAATGSQLSEAANIETARRLILSWLPISVNRRIKAIAIDLDETLFKGVLGEDGPTGVELTVAHKALQHRLVSLRDRGFIIILVSHNEMEDVEALFAARDDFPLTMNHFHNVSVGWGLKSTAIRNAAEKLRIGIDAILFIDDNPGQIVEVAASLPDITCLRAGSNAEEICRALDNFPGLFRWSVEEADIFRTTDLSTAVLTRSVAVPAERASAYLDELEVKLVFTLDCQAHQARMHELAHKTNQFSLALRRLSEPEIKRRLLHAESATITVHLTDRLANSGIIAVIWAHLDGADVVVEDICVSCRALGRGLENAMLLNAIKGAVRKLGGNRLGIDFTRGPRNEPACNWLAALAGAELKGMKGRIWFSDPVHAEQLKPEELPVEIEWYHAC